VVEDEQVALARQAARDPLGVVLDEQRLVVLGARAVGARVAPAVEQITTLDRAPATLAGGLGGGRAVVGDPDLAEVLDAADDLVEFGVVVEGIGVGPVRVDALRSLLGRADVADRLELVGLGFLGRVLGLLGRVVGFLGRIGRFGGGARRRWAGRAGAGTHRVL